MRYRIKQFIKGFKIFLNVALGYVLYLIPWSLLLMEKRPLSFAIMLVLTIAGLSIQYYKKEYRLVKDLKISELLNILAIGIVFVIAYLLILKLIPAKITYYNQFYYLSIYEYMSTPMYLLIASLLIPFLENFYIKSKLLKYQKNKYLTYGLIALNSIVIGFVQPYVIYGIFFGAISLMSSIYLMKTKNIVASTICQIIVNLVFCLFILYLSSFKLPLIIIMVSILILALLVNALKLKND